MTYPQQGGYGPPQGGGYGPPQGGGYGPPPPPQGPGYGYPPPGPGGYGQYPPPRKSNTGLIVGVVGVVAAAVVALVLVLVLTGDDDDPSPNAGGDTSEDSGLPNGLPGPNGSGSGEDSGGSSGGGSGSSSGGGDASSPEGLATIAVEVIETQDEDLIDEYACSSGAASQLKAEMTQLAGLDVSADIHDVQESGDTARATIEMSLGSETEQFTVEMEKDGDTWCVSGI
ncbi:hypothetical protein [Actinophytocola glycyrrhizae]|uniref:DUF4878 domain-containing protein n=1 Tax=Actinophytocola glycyrrhizae TaxID=2044873 RepID=A0ABV9RVH6_9PSEU